EVVRRVVLEPRATLTRADARDGRVVYGIDHNEDDASLEGFEKHGVHAVRSGRERVLASRVAGHFLLDDLPYRDPLPLPTGLEGRVAADSHPETQSGREHNAREREQRPHRGPHVGSGTARPVRGRNTHPTSPTLSTGPAPQRGN